MSKAKNIIIILAVVCVGLALLATFLIINLQNQQAKTNVTDFDSCVAAGNAVIETYPRQCKDKNSKTYTEAIEPSTQEFTSLKGIKARISNWVQGKALTSPLTITGEIPGNWSFEASFPVVLTNWDGVIIAQKAATLQGDWMTENLVPFAVTLEFESPTTYKNGTLILRKDNPSGLAENDDSIEIPVVYE
jgi:hypothetical protein